MPLRPMKSVAAATTLAALALPALAEEPPLRVLATVGMAADIAATVAGPCATVETLIRAGVDPHDYSATPSDVRRLSQAELILYVDTALEEALARVLDGFADRTPVVGLLAATFAPGDLLEDPDEPGVTDPHVWMDVRRWARIAGPVTQAIAAARPGCAADMEARAAGLSAQLDALRDWAEATLATIPENRRRLVTAHDAFNYFADAYGLEASEAVAGISTTAEASIADIRAVADYVIENGVPAVFVETTINPRTIEALVQEVTARGHDLRIGGALYSDSLGDPGTAEGTYVGMIRHNVATVARALGGSVLPMPDALADWTDAWGPFGD